MEFGLYGSCKRIELDYFAVLLINLRASCDCLLKFEHIKLIYVRNGVAVTL